MHPWTEPHGCTLNKQFKSHSPGSRAVQITYFPRQTVSDFHFGSEPPFPGHEPSGHEGGNTLAGTTYRPWSSEKQHPKDSSRPSGGCGEGSRLRLRLKPVAQHPPPWAAGRGPGTLCPEQGAVGERGPGQRGRETHSTASGSQGVPGAPPRDAELCP